MPDRKSRAETGLLILRVVISAIIAAHGWARWGADAVTPFGNWLDGLGFTAGLGIAWAVTLIEIVGTPVLAAGRLVPWLCLTYAFIYLTGIVLVHAPEGWFVVGLGRNGMEYSVLLVTCLLVLAWQHLPAGQKT